jgi:hypothetical protein
MENTGVEPTLENARLVFRSHRLGRLVGALPDGLETRAEDCHFIVDGRTGQMIFPATTVMLDLENHTIFLPDECTDSAEETLELEVTLAHEPMVSEALRDRHLAYHGHIRGGVWVHAAIDAARFGDQVFDGTLLQLPNGLFHDEPMLCRRCNASKDQLVRAAHHRLGLHGPEIMAVGVDGFGIDLRVGHRVLRVEFADEAATAEEAASAIDAFLEEGDRA